MATDADKPGEAPSGRWPGIRQWGKSFSTLIAGIGVVAAGIGYLSGGAHFASGVLEHFRGQSELRALTKAADDRLTHADYEAAWATNNKALQINPNDPQAKAAQLRIAMRWLEDVHVSSAAGPQNFAAVVDPLKAVLIERLANAQGKRKADIQAHIGWANFLRYRDGFPPTDIGEEFDAAVANDPGNFYGHLMRGFWALWKGGPIDEAVPDFDVAMQGGVDPAFANGIIMASLTNNTSNEFMSGAVTYADRIRQTGHNIDAATKRKLIWTYSICLHDADLLAAIGKALPASEQVKFLDWLKQSANARDQLMVTYFMAYFAALDGKKDDAIKLYGEIVAATPDKYKSYDNLYLAARAAMRKLQSPRKDFPSLRAPQP